MMNDSPIISNEIKEYLKANQIEENLNEIINKILIELPKDPYSELIERFTYHSYDFFSIINISLSKKFTFDFKPIPQISVSVQAKGRIFHESQAVSSSNEVITIDDLYEKVEKVYKKMNLKFENEMSFDDISLFDSYLENIIKDIEKNTTPSEFDEMNLSNNFDKENEKLGKVKDKDKDKDKEKGKGLEKEKTKQNSFMIFSSILKNITITISTLVYKAYSNSKSESLCIIIKELIESKQIDKNKKEISIEKSSSTKTTPNTNVAFKKSGRETNNNKSSKSGIGIGTGLGGVLKIPNLCIQIFKCGKGISKVKFERFFIIIDFNNLNLSSVNNNKEFSTISSLSLLISFYFKSIQSTTRKILTAGKLGENGFRLNNDGSHFSPYDTINETIKVIEEIIKEVNKEISSNSNITSQTSIKLTIGIDCNGNNFFNEEQKKYEMDGVKKPMDSEEMIDFYVKFISDHPLITYIEDPMSVEDIIGWKRIYKRFDEKNLLVKIFCKRVIGNSIFNLKTHYIPVKMEEVIKKINHNRNVKEKDKEVIEEKEINPDILLQEMNQLKVLPTNISLSFNEFFNCASFIDCIKLIRSKKFSLISISDPIIDFNCSSFIEICFGVKCDFLVLCGINSKTEKHFNFMKFLENVDNLV